MAEGPVDLSKASDQELQQIHGDVLRKLTERAIKAPSMMDGYDRHGSGHSRSGGSSTKMAQVSQPGGG